ncbi:unnamed protein product [Rotaria socialis]|uniref:Carrier domain-containing protein n=1 Tax=Rotaria socialis TaxID=392032 RepID=A0A820ZM99_9BILA|nr:unnamed protein product [Rotaria socialis]
MEVKAAEIIRHLHSDCKLYNIYGSAECPLITTYHVSNDELFSSNKIDSLSIGQPCPNIDYVIIDKKQHLVCPGEIGELCINSPGLFAGYFERENLMNELKFQVNDAIFYKTGDMVRIDQNHSLHFVKRSILELNLHGKCAREKTVERTTPKTFNGIDKKLNLQYAPSWKSIAELPITLPEEVQQMKFHRISNIVDRAPASSAQARIWLDERIRFNPENPEVAIYNMSFPYRIAPGSSIQIKQLRKALQIIILKHESLRTAIFFDSNDNILMQKIVDATNPNNQLFEFVESQYTSEEELNSIMHDERGNPKHFNVSIGRVCRCRIARHKENFNEDCLQGGDLLVFTIHHSLFDFPSLKVFLSDLSEAYITRRLPSHNEISLRYIDYSHIEREDSMTMASKFWLDALRDCEIDQLLPLPFDRQRTAEEFHTGRGRLISIDFGEELSQSFLTYASAIDTTLERLALTSFYIFLFKLTNGVSDLCVAMNIEARYKLALFQIIGMFVNAIPVRCKINPFSQITQLIYTVNAMLEDTLKHAYFPLQRILAQHPFSSKPAFLDTAFEFQSNSPTNAYGQNSQELLGDANMCTVPFSVNISPHEVVCKYDFFLNVRHCPVTDQMSLIIHSSVDLFEMSTIDKISSRFFLLLKQMLLIKEPGPICELSLILPDETFLIKSINNTQVSFSPFMCIHHQFATRADEQPQKVAVIFDEQSLTYSELLYYAHRLSKRFEDRQSQIICQCVQRSIEMIIGQLAIIFCGAAYCPLSSDNSSLRLATLVKDTGSELVLVQTSTRSSFSEEFNEFLLDITTEIRSMIDLNMNSLLEEVKKCDSSLDDRVCTSQNNTTADLGNRLLFTSGSTGTPKMLQITHRNFAACMVSFAHIDNFHGSEVVIQTARCSFDIHVAQSLGTLILGGSVVLIHEEGQLDLDYLTTTIERHDVTHIMIVPSLLSTLCEHLMISDNFSRLAKLQWIAIGGETIFPKTLSQLAAHLNFQKIRIENSYGPAECTIATFYHRITMNNIEEKRIPIGTPFPNTIIQVLDEFHQPVIPGAEGELFIAGLQRFLGYYRHDELNNQALFSSYYYSGDLVRIDTNGLLYYIGRKDHQIKLKGQRIELGEIERCLLGVSSQVTACIVVKWRDNYLVAYVQSQSIGEEQLRQHCHFHLPPYMVPSIIIILDQFPLTVNGKIDRKQLPSPDFSSTTLSCEVSMDAPRNHVEEKVHALWCQVIKTNIVHIRITANFFTVGGHSLLLTELYYRYQSAFGFDSQTIGITPFLRQATIVEHAKILENIKVNCSDSTTWFPLNINEGIASFAQERIFLDECKRFTNRVAVYNIVSVWYVVSGELSLVRLQESIQSLLIKHKILDTSLFFNSSNSELVQRTNFTQVLLNIENPKTFLNDEELHSIIRRSSTDSNLFDLASGRVFYCELLRNQSSENSSNSIARFMSPGDAFLFAFHHAAVDRTSLSFFFDDLCEIYNCNTSVYTNVNAFQYLDYSVHERTLDTSSSQQFWRSQMNDYDWNRHITLPADRHRLSTDERLGLGSIAEFSFDNELSQRLLAYCSSHQMTLFQLGLAIFTAFLFKLISEQTELCVTCLHANRYKQELSKMIGMFVSTLPYRIPFNATDSFQQLAEKVRDQCLSVLEHSHYPLQHILADSQKQQLSNSFLETAYDLLTVTSDDDKLNFDGTEAKHVSLSEEYEATKFDFMLMGFYNPSPSRNIISFSLICASDLFNQSTVEILARRFSSVTNQLFGSELLSSPSKSLYQLSIMLPEDLKAIEALNCSSHNTKQLLSNNIVERFNQRASMHPQKMAVELDNQSLTYGELLYHAQYLALRLLEKYNIKPGYIICQCMERSISMVIGIMAIEMCGAIYCSLSPDDPQERLQKIIEKTQPHLALFHATTLDKMNLLDTKIQIESFDNTYDLSGGINLDRLSANMITGESIAYAIFTSGSTGTPKAVRIRHQNFISCIDSLVSIGLFSEEDIITQMAQCSFDVHTQEIIGTLIIGATIIMLHPHGTKDLEYLISELRQKQVTYIQMVPAFINFLIDNCQYHDNLVLPTIRTIDIGGEIVYTSLIRKLRPLFDKNTHVYNLYGPAETTVDCTCHYIEIESDGQTVPIGQPLPHCECFLVDQYLQNVIVDQEGELLVGGCSVFAGYLGREDLTSKALVNIDGQLFYRTGDLVRLSKNSLLYYVGRIDYQIKLHGQRIEVAEIEQCVIKAPGQVRGCVVIKYGNHNLVAYVEGSSLKKEKLRGHCRSNLPSFMIPSEFILLDRFPLNANGKIDRSQFPTPNLSVCSTDPAEQHQEPIGELEILIHKLWCELLNCSRISRYENIFSIGGHSLLLMKLYQHYKRSFEFDSHILGIAQFFQHPTLANHAGLIEQATKKQCNDFNSSFKSHRNSGSTLSAPETLVTCDVNSRYNPFPLTNIQQAYLIGRIGVFELGHVSCYGYEEYDCPTLNIERFETALNQIIQRHEALRLIFPSESEQQILEHVPYYRIHIVDLRDQSEEYVYNQLEIERNRLSHQVLPAEKWPLFNFQITLWDYQHLRLHVGFDALLMDWTGYHLMWYELCLLYLNNNTILPTLRFSFRDYILAEQELRKSSRYENDKKYWLNRLKTFPSGPNMPMKTLPSQIENQKFARLSKFIDVHSWNMIRERTIGLKLSPTGVLAAVYAIILARWSQQNHFSLNLPIFNRIPMHPDIDNIIGDFTSVVTLEINLEKSEQTTFVEQVRTIQTQLWEDFDHASFSGVAFINELKRSNHSQEILLPIVLTCVIDATSDDRNKSMFLAEHLFHDPPIYAIAQTPQVFLDNQIYEEIDGRLGIVWDYVDELFPTNMINDMHNAFIDLLHHLASSDESWHQPYKFSLSLSQQEHRFAFNSTKWDTRRQDTLLHELIIEQAERTPHALAVLSSRRTFTYRELMSRVYSMANYLHQQMATHHQFIAILMEKGWEQIVACLAILMCGVAYLPLDIDSPDDRISCLIEESNVKIILTQSNQQRNFDHLSCISVDTFLTEDCYSTTFFVKNQKATDLAYVIYTSGSTGRPKGVMISHESVINTILDINSRLDINDTDRIFALSHLNFDLSVYDIFGALSAGATVVIPDHHDYKNPSHWYELILEHRVTIWNSVPMLMQMLVEFLHDKSSSNQLRHILLSGDWIPISLPKSIKTTFGNDVIITSLGGATEASIWSIAYTLPENIPTEWKSIPYGTPLRNQHYYVYDSDLSDCPEWVTGELYIGGIGLAKGYWKDEKKTNASFITHPHTSERLYRTGDYGRFVPDGYIEFIGRTDFQVKLHGYRIELEDIEYNLQQHPDINQAFVTFDKQSHNLIGYVLPYNHASQQHHYNISENFIKNSNECTGLKSARHNYLNSKTLKKRFYLRRPEQTEELVDTYFARKSYRQFTNQPITILEVEMLLKSIIPLNKPTFPSSPTLCDYDSLSRLLAALTSLILPDRTLPKYRYASARSLYPIQVFVEFSSKIDNIEPGFYYHNPDEHSLENIGEDNYDCSYDHLNNDNGIRFHLVGRQSASLSLYVEESVSALCLLETGYIFGLLEKAALTMGWHFEQVYSVDREKYSPFINLHTNDTHSCFSLNCSVVMDEETMEPKLSDFPSCYLCFRSSYSQNVDKNQWYVLENHTAKLKKLSCYSTKHNLSQHKSLVLTETDAIFMSCQVALFIVSQANQYIEAGKIGHFLMDAGIQKNDTDNNGYNIGMCPIETCSNLCDKSVLNTLDEILTFKPHSKLLHTIFIGKIGEDQKRDKIISSSNKEIHLIQMLQKYLATKLPSYMIPSLFVKLNEIPISSNGKVDRKCLPKPDYSKLRYSDTTSMIISSPLETQIQSIFSRVLGKESPAINVSFGQLGGTSLDAIRIVSIIREEIHENVNIGILLSNPSVHQLAEVINRLPVRKEVSADAMPDPSEEKRIQPKPSVLVETCGILFLACQWLFPFWMTHTLPNMYFLLFVPIFHLISYVAFRLILFGNDQIQNETDNLYSGRYYRWWFLDRLWSINNTYWLQHLLGTQFYNYYLRLCGAKISSHAHIYTTAIDAPWLLEIGDSTYIGSETLLSALSLYDQSYRLQKISIGCNCSIGTRCVLYEGVKMSDGVFIEPMTSITGNILPSAIGLSIESRALAWHHIIYQFICLVCLGYIHLILLNVTLLVYTSYAPLKIALPIYLAFIWLFWSLSGLFVVIALLKFAVGSTKPGQYRINSYYYLHKLWLRQLIISSFQHSIKVLPVYSTLSNYLLRWLGADIEDDVKLAELQPLLYFPSNLLKLNHGVTTFSAVMFVPLELMQSGHCFLDQIVLGQAANLGNYCTIMPGTKLRENKVVGSLTLINKDTKYFDTSKVLLGIPGRSVSFAITNDALYSDNSLSLESPCLFDLFAACMFFFIGKSILIVIYWFLAAPTALFAQITLFCVLQRYRTFNQRILGKFAYSEIVNPITSLINSITDDFDRFIAPFICRTQFLVFLYRALGARIGHDVILSDRQCLTDPQLVTIGDHVRFNTGACIQCHTFEQRVFKVAPVTIHHSSVLMSASLVFPGSTLDGRNRLFPLTLVLKSDRLPYNTHWSGVPAQQIQ